jgi:hypothetical protein
MMVVGVAALLVAACRSNVAPPPAAAPVAASAPIAAAAPATPAAGTGAASARIAMLVTDEGFVPSRIPAKRGQPLILAITRNTDHTCARDIVFQGQEGKTPLPLGKTVEVTYTPKASGEIKFGCAMGMMVSGVLARVTKVAAAAEPRSRPRPRRTNIPSMPASVTPRPPGRKDSAPATVIEA